MGHQTATGIVISACSRDREIRVEAQRTAHGEALLKRRRTRVRFPAAPPPDHGYGGRTKQWFSPRFCVQGTTSTSMTQAPNVTLNDGNTIPQLGFGVFQIKPEDTAER